VLVFLDEHHWAKCGIELCDGIPRLSVVICNVFSDWSTQPWPSHGARLRVHKVLQSSSIVVEAAPLGSEDFQFVRIAHLSARSTHNGSELTEVERVGSEEEKDWRIGPFSACVTHQKGCVATFSNLRLGSRLETAHSSDVSDIVK
jgi:uncharacterized protein